MNNTPETDDQPIIYAINDNGYQVPCVDIEYARKLERERDQAIAGRQAYKQLAVKHAQERDEAREALEHIVEYWNRDENETSMADALWHIIQTAVDVLHATKLNQLRTNGKRKTIHPAERNP